MGLGSLISTGASAWVYRGLSPVLGEVAVKVAVQQYRPGREGGSGDAGGCGRSRVDAGTWAAARALANELHILTQLQHPNVVKCFWGCVMAGPHAAGGAAAVGGAAGMAPVGAGGSFRPGSSTGGGSPFPCHSSPSRSSLSGGGAVKLWGASDMGLSGNGGPGAAPVAGAVAPEDGRAGGLSVRGSVEVPHQVHVVGQADPQPATLAAPLCSCAAAAASTSSRPELPLAMKLTQLSSPQPPHRLSMSSAQTLNQASSSPLLSSHTRHSLTALPAAGQHNTPPGTGPHDGTLSCPQSPRTLPRPSPPTLPQPPPPPIPRPASSTASASSYPMAGADEPALALPAAEGAPPYLVLELCCSDLSQMAHGSGAGGASMSGLSPLSAPGAAAPAAVGTPATAVTCAGIEPAARMQQQAPQQLVTQLSQQGPQLALADALKLLLGVAQGLAYLHSVGLSHGDLKPANVLVRVPPM